MNVQYLQTNSLLPPLLLHPHLKEGEKQVKITIIFLHIPQNQVIQCISPFPHTQNKLYGEGLLY